MVAFDYFVSLSKAEAVLPFERGCNFFSMASTQRGGHKNSINVEIGHQIWS